MGLSDTKEDENRKPIGTCTSPSKKITPVSSQWLSKALLVSKMSKESARKKDRMLTYSELSDLFRRLDKDGSGTLDLEEFAQIITKLKIAGSEEYVAE